MHIQQSDFTHTFGRDLRACLASVMEIYETSSAAQSRYDLRPSVFPSGNDLSPIWSSRTAGRRTWTVKAIGGVHVELDDRKWVVMAQRVWRNCMLLRAGLFPLLGAAFANENVHALQFLQNLRTILTRITIVDSLNANSQIKQI